MSLTPQQARAVERSEGSLLVRAGAGPGKTTVLVERIVRAVAEGGVPVGQILAITFTEKSAAEMRGRVRKALLARGRRDLARAAQDAWISTIHGFCSRVLRAHALSAGIDPQYRVLEQVEADRVGADAFDRALERFLGEGEDAQHLELVASYTPDRLRDMVGSVHSNLRSRGHLVPSLAPLPLPLPAGEHARLARAAQVALAELAQVGEGKKVLGAIAALERCGEALGQLADGTLSPPEAPGNWKLGGGANALKTPACLEYKEALEEYEALCVAHREHHHHTLLRELLEPCGEQYAQLKRERSGLDFEDLQLFARDLLRDNKPLCEQYSHRFAQILVDEFQDVNPLQNELLGLLARDNLFRVGDQNQSIYGFRNADVKVFERQYEAARSGGQAESITVNYRSRGEVLDAIDLTFSRLWGERFEPLQEAPGVREQPPRLDPSIELLVSDNHKGRWEAHFGEGESPFGSWPPETAIWRVCEARLLAKRIDELTR
ncbi:MAG TPA: UvrD-helicase domain-containing protein, partial [Thermoleophilaceae bacterium]|nr:UvrD-helicase domain-containing protein [Thermoleophilaceae bacterium]